MNAPLVVDVARVCSRCLREGHSASQHCDDCGVIVTTAGRLRWFADVIGVDWVLCAPCESRNETRAIEARA